ncbi:hypothetical protein ESCO_001221 [Escovopsis weberi]|uniref:Uncharacterized protein n=1 Tax=Escovopsis weberi TaxID=150374 RepID=A0A0M9VTQ0_ESCWE|nr:hypothetical protein ESCO_001221 [Escovopsis weberi]
MSSQNQAAGRKRLVHHLDTPFSTTSWPDITQDDQDAILELLCSFLNPLGQHRRLLPAPSKGRRAARRGRKAAAGGSSATGKPAPGVPPQPKPELDSSIDVGFNSITRNLQAQASSPASSSPTDAGPDVAAAPPYSMVFVARGNQSSAFHCHFPHMVGAASQRSPAGEKTRLVGFSRPCSERLSSVLGVPRVSSVAVKRTAPGAQALLAFVEQKVAPVRVSWMGEGEGGGTVEYCPTQISSTETTVGAKRVRQS